VSADGALTHLFPTAAVLSAADLEDLGFPRARAGALKALAGSVVTGRLSFNGPVEEIVAKLEELPGAGSGVAHYVALRALSEPDAFPTSDLILRRAVGINGSPVTPRTLEQMSEAWRPWRGYAAMHLWSSSTSAPKR